MKETINEVLDLIRVKCSETIDSPTHILLPKNIIEKLLEESDSLIYNTNMDYDLIYQEGLDNVINEKDNIKNLEDYFELSILTSLAETDEIKIFKEIEPYTF